MNNSLLSRFIPKESKFFPLLKQLSQIVLQAAELLIDSMEHDTSEKRQEYYRKIKEAERKGDQMTQLVFDELGKTFITHSTGRTFMIWLLPLTMSQTGFTVPRNGLQFTTLVPFQTVEKSWPCSSSKVLLLYAKQWMNWKHAARKSPNCKNTVNNFMNWRIVLMKFTNCLSCSCLMKKQILLN